MNSFSNAMMQRHLGQAETVSPRPLGLYEPVQNTGIENLNQIEQNTTDKGQDVTGFPLNDAKQLMQTSEVQKPYPLSEKEWPIQEPVHSKTVSSETAQKELQIIPSLLTSNFQAPVLPIPLLVTSANTPNSSTNGLNSLDIQAPVPPASLLVVPANTPSSSSNDSNSSDIQAQRAEQIVQQQMIQTQIERRIENHIEPIMKTDNAVGMVQPATNAINLESPIPFNQSERFTVPLPIMNHPSPTPVIKVSIGRIEVKAIIQTPSQPAKSSPSPKPRMSLDEYLKKQDNR